MKVGDHISYVKRIPSGCSPDGTCTAGVEVLGCEPRRDALDAQSLDCMLDYVVGDSQQEVGAITVLRGVGREREADMQSLGEGNR
jgi:hypothetical protein